MGGISVGTAFPSNPLHVFASPFPMFNGVSVVFCFCTTGYDRLREWEGESVASTDAVID